MRVKWSNIEKKIKKFHERADLATQRALRAAQAEFRNEVLDGPSASEGGNSVPKHTVDLEHKRSKNEAGGNLWDTVRRAIDAESAKWGGSVLKTSSKSTGLAIMSISLINRRILDSYKVTWLRKTKEGEETVMYAPKTTPPVWRIYEFGAASARIPYAGDALPGHALRIYSKKGGYEKPIFIRSGEGELGFTTRGPFPTSSKVSTARARDLVEFLGYDLSMYATTDEGYAPLRQSYINVLEKFPRMFEEALRKEGLNPIPAVSGRMKAGLGFRWSF